MDAQGGVIVHNNPVTKAAPRASKSASAPRPRPATPEPEPKPVPAPVATPQPQPQSRLVDPREPRGGVREDVAPLVPSVPPKPARPRPAPVRSAPVRPVPQPGVVPAIPMPKRRPEVTGVARAMQAVAAAKAQVQQQAPIQRPAAGLVAAAKKTSGTSLFTDEELKHPITASKVQYKVRRGLPASVKYVIHDNVTSLWGVDLTLLHAAVTNPDRVEIAPETESKGYPVLRMHRGDIMAAVGFRELDEPMVLAFYQRSGLTGDRAGGTAGQRGAVGGTGQHARRHGTPRTGKELLKRLLDMGAQYTRNADQKTANVYVEDQMVGTVSIAENTNPETIRTDYSRIGRRVRAITGQGDEADAS